MIENLCVIVGSVRKDRLGMRVAQWLLTHLDPPVDLIDLAGLDLPADLGGGGDADVFVKRIEQADAFVVVTPEYNHGYPGALKTAIDTALPEWRAKPVGFVSYGGVSGGLRAVEQLRAVFAELHVITMQTAVSVPFVWDRFDDDGNLIHSSSAVTTMLRQLDWWAGALRQAKAARPYAAWISAGSITGGSRPD